MVRAFGIGLLMVAGLMTGSALAGEPHDRQTPDTQSLRAQPPAQPDARTQSEIRLPPRIAAICTNAKSDLALVCAEYERLYRQTEVQKIDSAKRLKALTRGGVVEVLQ